MFKYFFAFFLLLVFLITSFNRDASHEAYGHFEVDEWSVEESLIKLGDSSYRHHLNNIDSQKAAVGKDLVFKGFTRRNGKKSKKISSYFVCTDCHNTIKEFSDANEHSPQKRLDYAIKNNITFLPGSTLWGIYNRTSFYNGDYRIKYQGLVDKAKNNLSEAIQICSEYCSSGRSLKEWELEAIMHYFKSLQLKIKDLNISSNQKKNIQKFQKLDNNEKQRLISLIKSSYVESYPANFLQTMPSDKRGYGKNGNWENGKEIFERSCLHCHGEKRVTYLGLDNSKLTGKFFLKYMKGYKDQSLYQIIRWGTYPKAGRRQYMPQYSKEKMSDKQIEDLIAYMRKITKKP